MDPHCLEEIESQLNDLKKEGLYKNERIITSAQQANISINDDKEVLNFCANNYLGLANHPQVIEAAKNSYAKWGFGLASVRFICGTQSVHKQLENKISNFHGTDDTILYSSCFDANGGLFETLFGEEDAIISDQLNHASIIDGIRLCKAKRLRYKNNTMDDLEEKLKETQGYRRRIIATDGVFSMDGTIANLKDICDLADRYKALVMIDDCHATGFLGENGRGTPEYRAVEGRIDIITSTLGKALGGASGGYTTGRQPIIDWLRQRSRPYLFSNSLAPSIASASLRVLDLITNGQERRKKLKQNMHYFRKQLENLGFNLVPGEHPIIPIMLGKATLAQQFAAKMLDHGIYVIGFSFPVVPQGQARIRTQLSAAHEVEHLDRAIAAFEAVGKELSVI